MLVLFPLLLFYFCFVILFCFTLDVLRLLRLFYVFCDFCLSVQFRNILFVKLCISYFNQSSPNCLEYIGRLSKGIQWVEILLKVGILRLGAGLEGSFPGRNSSDWNWPGCRFSKWKFTGVKIDFWGSSPGEKSAGEFCKLASIVFLFDFGYQIYHSDKIKHLVGKTPQRVIYST